MKRKGSFGYTVPLIVFKTIISSFFVLLSPAPTLAQEGRCVDGDGAHIRKVCLENIRTAPTYGHNVLGATPEWDELTVFWGAETRAKVDGRRGATTILKLDHIYEDVEPRLIDIDLDGAQEIVVVQSSFQHGARLLVYDTDAEVKELAATPYIGTRNRWLAPVGAADLDGDGHIEVAYVDRPHLAKTLRIWRFQQGELTEIASLPGVSNHRIGWDYIVGGMRKCGHRPEMILVTGNWSDVIALTFDGAAITIRMLGRYDGPESVDAALACH